MPDGGQGCKQGDNLYKSHAESYKEQIPRSNKPVLIFQGLAPDIELRVKDKVIYRFTYEKPYSHGAGYVYRAQHWGYEISEMILKEKNRSRENSHMCKVTRNRSHGDLMNMLDENQQTGKPYGS